MVNPEPTDDDRGVPLPVPPVGATSGAPAELPPASPAGRGMFGIQGSGDTSGFGGLVRRRPAPASASPPYGGYFDEVYDALEEAFPASTTRSRRSSSTAAS